VSTHERWVLFLNGMLTACYGLAALFFLRFRKRTGDRLFTYFAGAFALLMFQSAALQFVPQSENDRAPFYLIRFAAFALIAAAVVYKNRGRR
jgi:uncharacterized membrane protein HdeD (DUF308 family)